MRDEIAVFLSWRGRWSDSPRAISQELARRGWPVRQVWVLDDDVAHLLRGGMERVAPGGDPRAVRRELGLTEHTRAVLYAPTWRDTFRHTLGALDVDLLRRTLGAGTTLLLRAHGYTAASDPGAAGEGVRNVTRWPDIADLHLAVDVLVTDYSSSMFDFAGTGTPLLFLTYVLERYRVVFRGFYLDFAAEAPGPLLSSSPEVAEALRDLEAATAPHRDRYAAWVARFCPWDDGGASARAVDAVFGRQAGAGGRTAVTDEEPTAA